MTIYERLVFFFIISSALLSALIISFVIEFSSNFSIAFTVSFVTSLRVFASFFSFMNEFGPVVSL